MGMQWLWFYTDSTNPDSLKKSNEDRAFAVYSRWRSMFRWVGSLYDGYRQSRQERADCRELLALSDHLLRDVGLLRIGSDFQLEGPHQTIRSDQLASFDWPMFSEISGGCRVVPCVEPATTGVLHCVAPDESSRAA